MVVGRSTLIPRLTIQNQATKHTSHFLNQNEITYYFDIVLKGAQKTTSSKLLISAYMEPYSWWHVGALNATPPTMNFWFEVSGNELISTTTTTGSAVAELLFPHEGLTTVHVNIGNRTPESFLWCYGSECNPKKYIDYGVIQLTFYNLVPESNPAILVFSGLAIIFTKRKPKNHHLSTIPPISKPMP